LKVDNPFYFLPSSQLFPIASFIEKSVGESKVLAEARLAKSYVLAGDLDKALVVYNALVEEHPNHPFFFASRSILKTMMGEEEGAFYDYQVAKRLDFNYHTFLEWLNNDGQMVEADELQELITNESNNEQYYINRATLYVQHFEYEKAIADFSKAYDLGKNATVLLSRGAINMRILRYDEALADFNAALEKDMNLVQAYLFRAKLYVAIHEFELADNDFNNAIMLSTDDASIYEERAQFYELIGDWNLAIADYTTLIALVPDDFYAYVLRADLYEKTAQLEFALTDYTKAISLNPYYSDLYQYRGDIRKMMGDERGAQEDYSKFEELEDE